MSEERKLTRKHADDLIDTCADLQRRVLLKHTQAILEQFEDEIVKRNDRIATLRNALVVLMRDALTVCNDTIELEPALYQARAAIDAARAK